MKESDIKEAEESPPEDEAEESHGVIVVVVLAPPRTVPVAAPAQMGAPAHNAPVAQRAAFAVSNDD